MSTEDAGAGDDQVFELLHRVMHRYRAEQQRLAREAGGLELTGLEWRVLSFFARQPGASLSELVAHSGRDKAQLARLVKGLREAGLLMAEEDPADRRVVRLSLSRRAQDLWSRADGPARELRRRLLRGLSATQRRSLLDTLQQLHDNLGTGD